MAVQANRPLSADQRIDITEALVLAFNRPVDLVDLRTVGQPLLHETLSTGIKVLGSRHQWGDLLYRSIMENEDFSLSEADTRGAPRRMDEQRLAQKL